MAHILRADFQTGRISDNPLVIGATSINSAGFSTLPVVASPNVLKLTLDPGAASGTQEIVYVTAHTASATVCTITRAAEDATPNPARQHNLNEVWVCAPTATDWLNLPRGMLTSVQSVTAQTGITTLADITGMNVDYTEAPSRTYRLEAVLNLTQVTSPGTVIAKIYNTGLGVIAYASCLAPVGNFQLSLLGIRATGSGSGDVTWQVEASTSAGTLSTNVNTSAQANWLTLEDVGP